jgi:hypothetical protein
MKRFLAAFTAGGWAKSLDDDGEASTPWGGDMSSSSSSSSQVTAAGGMCLDACVPLTASASASRQRRYIGDLLEFKM